MVSLRDGSRVFVRPVEPSDRALLEQGFERLGPESRYRRFFSPVKRLSEQQLDYLTRIDHHDHEALLAIDERTGEAVAVARYVRVGNGLAEPAIAVIDDWQGRGLAGPLLELLSRRAREEGVRRFAAPILAENHAAVAVFERLGPSSKTHAGREIELLIDLPPRGRPRSPRRLLERAAERVFEPVLTLSHRLLPRRAPAEAPGTNAIVVELGANGQGSVALDRAADLARATRASVHLVSARPLLDDDPPHDSRASAAAAHLRRNGLRVQTHVRRGDLATLLLETAAAERAWLIVVEGSEQEGRLLGSAWDHVSHHAPCNVLVARG